MEFTFKLLIKLTTVEKVASPVVKNVYDVTRGCLNVKDDCLDTVKSYRCGDNDRSCRDHNGATKRPSCALWRGRIQASKGSEKNSPPAV